MVLGADPSQVPDDAAKVFEAVHTYNGIVLSSSVRGGSPGHAGAVFDLLIPSAKLGGALAALSEIGEVRSRQEAGRTSPRRPSGWGNAFVTRGRRSKACSFSSPTPTPTPSAPKSSSSCGRSAATPRRCARR